MSVSILFICILFAAVAFLYATVGHGGASGYLALMSLFAFTPDTIRPTALIINLAVSLVAFIQYYRSGYFVWHLFWPFAIASVPAAFAGSYINIDAGIYRKILAVLLLLSVIKLSGFDLKINTEVKKTKSIMLCCGATIGFLSGLIGIGGGIILSPLIILFKWADMKQTAAVSALFILVNSLAGLSALFSKGYSANYQVFLIGLIALAGGFAGAYFGATKFNNKVLRLLLSFVLVTASVKLMIT